jgi:hypothetical protein
MHGLRLPIDKFSCPFDKFSSLFDKSACCTSACHDSQVDMSPSVPLSCCMSIAWLLLDKHDLLDKTKRGLEPSFEDAR